MKIRYSHLAIFLAVSLLFFIGMPKAQGNGYTFDKATKTAVINDDIVFTLVNNTDRCENVCYATFEITSKKGGKLPMDYVKFVDMIDKPVNVNWEIVNGGPIELKNFNAVKDKKYTFTLKGTKDPYSNVDWVFSFGGHEIKELAWWNTTWTYCKNITITNAYPGNYTFLLELTSANITYAKFKSDGSDIRFQNGSCSGNGHYNLSHVVEIWNTSGNSYVWFKRNESSTAGTTIAMYYGNPAASDVSDWNNTFMTNCSTKLDSTTGYTQVGTAATVVTANKTINWNYAEVAGDVDGVYCPVKEWLTNFSIWYRFNMSSMAGSQGAGPGLATFNNLAQYNSGGSSVFATAYEGTHYYTTGEASGADFQTDSAITMEGKERYGRITKNSTTIIHNLSVNRNMTSPDINILTDITGLTFANMQYFWMVDNFATGFGANTIVGWTNQTYLTKYINPEPALSLGTEEVASAYVSSTISEPSNTTYYSWGIPLKYIVSGGNVTYKCNHTLNSTSANYSVANNTPYSTILFLNATGQKLVQVNCTDGWLNYTQSNMTITIGNFTVFALNSSGGSVNNSYVKIYNSSNSSSKYAYNDYDGNNSRAVFDPVEFINGSATVYLDTYGYQLFNQTYTFLTTTANYTTNLTKAGINITTYDDSTGNYTANTTTKIAIFNSTHYLNFTGNNFSWLWTEIPYGNITIVATYNNLTREINSYNNATTFNNYNISFPADAQIYSFRTVNFYQVAISEVLSSFYKTDGSLITQRYSQSDGYINEIALSRNVPITIYFYKSGYEPLNISFTPYATTYLPVVIQLSETMEEEIADNYYEIVLSTESACTLYEVDATHNYLVCDANGTYVDNSCISVYNVNLTNETAKCNFCNTTPFTSNCSVGAISGNYTTYRFYSIYNGNQYTLEAGSIDRRVTTLPEGRDNSLVFTIIVFLGCSMLFVFNPKYGIIAGCLGLWVMVLFQMFDIGIAPLIGMTLVGVLLAYKVR